MGHSAWDYDMQGIGVPKGDVYGFKAVNKFGRAPEGIQVTRTDVWDRADSNGLQSIWLAPTEARQHIIISSSVNDTAGGTGMRTLRLYGLPNWGTKEVSEEITLLGNVSTVITATSYVIIHRMKGLTFGTGNSANLGVIHAVAQADSTVTAQINAKEGQTQMAIYGVPSSQTAFITQYYATVNKAQGAAASINMDLAANVEPDIQSTSYLVKNTRGIQSTGNSGDTWDFNPFFTCPGPCILKVQGIANTADVEVSAGFDLVLVDND